MKQSGLDALLYGQIWAILPEKLRQIEAVYMRWLAGETLSIEQLAAIKSQSRSRAAERVEGTYVLPLVGTISQRANMLSESSGGVSTEKFSQDFHRALADPAVGRIVLDIDSPGGSVSGVAELAEEIFQARGSKPIIAVANSLAASAAYWIASAADELVVTPSGQVGSIGVFAIHQDQSALEERVGVKTTLISAGKFKTEANPHEPLSESAAEHIQSQVDFYYGQFVSAVAKYRGVTSAQVRQGFGQGRVVVAPESVAEGMADRQATLAETIRRGTRSANKRSRAASHKKRMQLLALA